MTFPWRDELSNGIQAAINVVKAQPRVRDSRLASSFRGVENETRILCIACFDCVRSGAVADPGNATARLSRHKCSRWLNELNLAGLGPTAKCGLADGAGSGQAAY